MRLLYKYLQIKIIHRYEYFGYKYKFNIMNETVCISEQLQDLNKNAEK